ncbi:MAG: EAL domain-containing protein [Myxococcales bacterium]|nr:EAL domain-containing protein [Myxococcales bacterium]MDH5305614.1 EAL domain-containing protein [Myxococcales bacterium]MDH5565714.1 EAL domain-containing protein [Myxococcales bacterium]
MSESGEIRPIRGVDTEPPGRIGERLALIAEKFDDYGAMGLLLIEADGLEAVERSYGATAHRRAVATLVALVQELAGDRLSIDDLIVRGETGRNEIAILLFRDPGEVDFYKRELPLLRRMLWSGLRKRGQRVGYPYTRTLAPMQVGTGAALRNPTIGAESQLRSALEEAREHAALESRLESRQRRKRLFELVIDGHVRSVYEPIVEVATRTVFGYEALARGPEGTELHTPYKLFAMATEQDLLFQLDCLCRRSAIDGARDYPRGAKLFLNVRPTTIHDPSFQADALEQTLERCQLRPNDVVFEISEQESIENFAIFREVRDYYGKLGFQIALDDTGAGYASLEAVMELAPDFVKVDRAFVAGINEDLARQEVLRALKSVAQQIGAQIIGEGLDTLEELETLQRLGIPYGQGWLFGKPHPLRSDT